MWLATPTLINPPWACAAPTVGHWHSGFEQTNPARFASRSIVRDVKSSLTAPIHHRTKRKRHSWHTHDLGEVATEAAVAPGRPKHSNAGLCTVRLPPACVRVHCEL